MDSVQFRDRDADWLSGEKDWLSELVDRGPCQRCVNIGQVFACNKLRECRFLAFTVPL